MPLVLPVLAAPGVNGTYEMNSPRRENTLYVKELDSKRIKFAMNSILVTDPKGGMANTGQAGGVAERSGNSASYKKDGLTLRFTFAKGKCKVDCPATNWYGGMGVDPNGTYKRTSAATPSEKQLTPQD